MSESLLQSVIEQETNKPWQYWEELITVTGDDAEMNRRMREEWFSKSRQDPYSVRNYYSESDTWLANTLKYRRCLVNAVTFSPQPLESWQIEFVKYTSGKEILDFGSGCLNDSWKLVTNGYRLSMAEVAGPLTKIAENYVRSVGNTNISVIAVSEEFPIRNTYDGIICLETLEHVKNPQAVLKHLVDHLQSGGPLAMSVSFGDTPHAPYHLAELAPFGATGVWDDYSRSIGLDLVYEHPASSMKIWRKQ